MNEMCKAEHHSISLPIGFIEMDITQGQSIVHGTILCWRVLAIDDQQELIRRLIHVFLNIANAQAYDIELYDMPQDYWDEVKILYRIPYSCQLSYFHSLTGKELAV